MEKTLMAGTRGFRGKEKIATLRRFSLSKRMVHCMIWEKSWATS